MAKKKGNRNSRKYCEKCDKQINIKKDNFILMGTYNMATRSDEECFFHIDCFRDYFNDCVMRKMEKNISSMQDQAMSLFNSPIIKDLLSQVQGSGLALNMLQTPLQKEHFDLYHKKKIEQVKKAIKKIKNGRKKRTKRKTKMHKV